jgi:hypothetical protein
MYPSDWTVLPVEPYDAIALDGIEDLSVTDPVELMSETPIGPSDRQMTTAAWTWPWICAPDRRHHMPAPSTPAYHFSNCP